jgi:putative ATPase
VFGAGNPIVPAEPVSPAIASIAARLLPGGRFVLAQSIPRRGQRLYELVEWGGENDLREKVAAAEEAIYADGDDEMVNWDETDLALALEGAGLTVDLRLEQQTEERLVTTAHLARWFGAGEGGRPSYAARLVAGGLSAAEVKAVQGRYERQLAEKTVEWRSALALLTASQLA